jgi:hypothetical protein
VGLKIGGIIGGSNEYRIHEYVRYTDGYEENMIDAAAPNELEYG